MKKLFLLSLIVCSGAYAEDMSYYKKMGESLQTNIKPNFHDAKPIVEGNIPDISSENMHQRGEALKSEHMALLKEVDLKRKNFEVSFDDSFLDRARDVQANPESYVDFLSGKYSNCKVDSEDITTKEEHICDDYTSYNENTCSVGRKIEVDAKHKYVCEKRRNTYEKTCEKNLQLKCKASEECDANGIVLKSIASDMKWEYKYPYLILGTIADNYWGGSCNKYDRTTSFEVKNKEAIEEFIITEVGFDDYMRVSINDTQVYIGPYLGNKLETKKVLYFPKVDTGGAVYRCELSTNWKFSTSIDLKPHLKEGINKIRIEVIVAGLGEGWIKIKTKQHCCKEWEESWIENCGGSK